jgi:hypothetical protein
MESSRPYPLEKFVPLALKQIARNKPIIIIPLLYRVLWRMYRISPPLGIALSRMMFLRMREELKKIESSR